MHIGNSTFDRCDEAKAILRSDGYLLLRSCFDLDEVARLNLRFQKWRREAAAHRYDFGDINSGKRRFVLGANHSEYSPSIKRINNPCDVDAEFFDFVLVKQIVPLAQYFLGEFVRFHHCKINCKSGPADGAVDLHQDFGFDPHTNRSLLTFVVPLDDVSKVSGCLEVVPKSHLKLLSHFKNNRFVGAIPNGWAIYNTLLLPIELNMGDCLVLDGALIHGSRPNTTQKQRPILFSEFSAVDALPLAAYHVPSIHSGKIFPATNKVFPIRLEAQTLEVPGTYSASSIFDLQHEERSRE